MATVTDTQQLKDLITGGNIATQKQISDGQAAMQKQVAQESTYYKDENYGLKF